MDSKIKKIITDEWLKTFPNLNALSRNKLYKIIGPFICGIELVNLPRSQEYRPHFVVYSLWKGNVKSCLEYPSLLLQFYDEKKLQIDLPYNDVSDKYKEAQKIVSNNLKISFAENVALEKLFSLIDNVLENDITCKFNSGKVASLFELKFYASLYTGNQIQVENVFNQIEQLSKNWNMQMFEIWYGKFDTWLHELKKKQNDRDDFLKQIEANKQDKRIARLQCSELVA